jgi:hypothetical protein
MKRTMKRTQKRTEKRTKRRTIRQSDEVKSRRVLRLLHSLREPQTLAELTAFYDDRGSRTVRRDLELLQSLGFQIVGRERATRHKEFRVVGWQKTMKHLIENP